MFNSFYKTCLLALFSMIFIGQSLASSVMVYKMMPSMNHVNENAAIEVSHHHAQSDDGIEIKLQETKDNDCCKVKCHCFTSGCSALSTLSSFVNSALIINPSEKFSLIINNSIDNHSSSLYRPPILS